MNLSDDPNLAKRKRLMLPWEEGFLGSIFGRNASSGSLGFLNNDVLEPQWDPRMLNSISKEAAVHDTPVPDLLPAGEKHIILEAYKLVGTKKTIIPWSDTLIEERNVALERWRLIIDVCPAASRVGRQLLACNAVLNSGARAESILKDTFEGKASGTLNSRSASLLSYIRWHNTVYPAGCSFPLDENTCYDYLSEMRSAKRASSFMKKFKEAIGFAFGVLGLDGASECLESRRLSGVAFSTLSTKEFERQCDDFEVHHLKLLETAAINLGSGPDKIFAGFNVFKTHARARHSDTYFCLSEPMLDLDSLGWGYVELQVHKTKTSNTAARQRKRLPLVAHSVGISGLRWAEAYVKEREVQDLKCEGGPLMPSITYKGTWNKGRLSSGDANIWLRELILKLGGALRPGTLIATHTCKHTMLAWLAKFCVPIGIRRILGGHLKAKEGSAIVYSRDALAGPLRELQKMIESIQRGEFHPDETRSGRFAYKEPVQACELVLEPEWSSSILQPKPKSLPKQSDTIQEERGNLPDDTFSELENGSIEHVPSDGERAEEQELLEEDDGFGPAVFCECRACGLLQGSNSEIRICDTCGLEGCTSCLAFIASVDHVQRCYQCFDDDAKLQEQESSSSSDDSSDSNGEDSESEAARNAEVIAVRLTRPGDPRSSIAKNSVDQLIQHKTLRTIHLSRLGSACLLACGRQWSTVTHESLPSEPAFKWPRCKDCFRKVQE